MRLDRPVNVCHIMSADLWAGAEVQVATLCSYLATRDEVRPSAVLLHDGQLAHELRTLGIDVAVFDERHHSAFRTIRYIATFLAERKIDLVHTHRYKDTILGATAARLAGVPHVVRTVHGLPEPLRGWARAKFLAWSTVDKAVLWCCADRVIAVSERVAQTLMASGYRPSSVIAIHNGVDLSRIRPLRGRDAVRQELGIPTDAVVIGSAGRLSPVKAQCSLLRAARRILDERPGSRILLAGDGPRLEELRALAAALGIARESVFAGARTDIYDVIASMDIFVLPSLSEGIPLALLEAMALGRPVVATDVGGIPEIIQHRWNGLLVEPRNPDRLASACLELMRDTALAETIASRARRTVQSRFSHETNGRAMLETYRTVCAPARSIQDGRPTTAALCRHLIRGFAVHAWRKVSHTIAAAAERRRMARLRRDPTPLVGALRSAARILVVCQGNIIRSPFAASLVARSLGNPGRVTIQSAGLEAVPGKPPHPTALRLASSHGVDLAGHAASPVGEDAIAASDAVFVMEVPQLVSIRRRFPAARSKTFLLTCLASDTPLEVQDPYAGDESEFEACFDHISRAVQPIVRALSEARSFV